LGKGEEGLEIGKRGVLRVRKRGMVKRWKKREGLEMEEKGDG
jgi:hypothetical protein